jgi:hypothetical protein
MVDYFDQFEPHWDEALAANLQESEEALGWKQAVRNFLPFADMADWELEEML